MKRKARRDDAVEAGFLVGELLTTTSKCWVEFPSVRLVLRTCYPTTGYSSFIKRADSIDQHRCRIFHQLLHAHEEEHRLLSVDDAVIV